MGRRARAPHDGGMTATAAGPLECDPNSLNEAMASWMESKVGTVEDGRNDGPEIREWLRLVKQPPGAEWCAATVHAAGYYSAIRLKKVNPVPCTASALKIGSLAEPITRVDGPARGRVFVVDHGGGKGHAGICLSVDENGVPTCASGNTNAEGSRVGDRLATHAGDPTVVHHGIGPTKWYDFDLAAQPPPGYGP